jgi:hypothetical protein
VDLLAVQQFLESAVIGRHSHLCGS